MTLTSLSLPPVLSPPTGDFAHNTAITLAARQCSKTRMPTSRPLEGVATGAAPAVTQTTSSACRRFDRSVNSERIFPPWWQAKEQLNSRACSAQADMGRGTGGVRGPEYLGMVKADTPGRILPALDPISTSSGSCQKRAIVGWVPRQSAQSLATLNTRGLGLYVDPFSRVGGVEGHAHSQSATCAKTVWVQSQGETATLLRAGIKPGPTLDPLRPAMHAPVPHSSAECACPASWAADSRASAVFLGRRGAFI